MFLLLPFLFDGVGLETLLTAVLLIERLDARLGTEVQRGRRVFLRQLKQPAADPLLLVFRQDQQLGDGSEIAAVRQDAQTAGQHIAVPGGDVQRF